MIFSVVFQTMLETENNMPENIILFFRQFKRWFCKNRTIKEDRKTTIWGKILRKDLNDDGQWR